LSNEQSQSANHESTDWQIASDASFNTIVKQSLADTSNKTSYSFDYNDFSTSTEYFFRVRVKDAIYGYSSYSATHSFTTVASFGWQDISGASYDSVSFSINSQDTVPVSMAFNTTGTKMYVLGAQNDSVYQYTLSTPYNVGTASYDSVSFSVGSQEADPEDFTFNSDGTKMYVVGADLAVYQYSLSTGFNLSTASYDTVSFSVATEDSSSQGVVFKPDGTKMYIVGNGNDSIFQYSLSTPFDISTASYDSVSFSVGSQETVPVGMAFDSFGTKMYVVGVGNDTVYQYSLSTPYNVGTASYDNDSFSVGTQENPQGLAFNSIGTKMYIVGNTNNSVFQYDI